MPVSKKEQQRRADAKRAASRSRNWAFVFYPGDSAPDNWREIIEGWRVPCAVSPLHNDKNPDDSDKKVHRHGVLTFDSNKTRDQVNEMVAPLGVKTVIKLNSVVGYLRYLVHMDNPEKNQYDVNDVETFSGLDYRRIVETASDKIAVLHDIMDFIDDNRITKYSALMRYARKERADWFYILANGYTLVIAEYLKGVWLEEKENEDHEFEIRQVKDRAESLRKK